MQHRPGRAARRLTSTYEMAKANRGVQSTSSSLKDLREVTSFIGSPNFSALLDVPWAPAFTVLIFLIHPTPGSSRCAPASC